MQKKKITTGGIATNTTKGNKTGAWRSIRPEITEKCIGCGICVNVCPEGCIEVKDISGKRKAIVDYNYCKGCMICATQCPQKAINKKPEC